MELVGRLAVVTGGAEGIGAAIVRGLVADGADVVAVDVKPVDEAALREARVVETQRIGSVTCDVTSFAAIRDACLRITAEWGPTSILVNNVGGSGSVPAPTLETTTDEVWEHVMTLNIGAALRFSRELVAGMKSLRDGRIINISSSLRDGIPGPSDTMRAPLPYVTAKSALVGFTKQLAIDLGPFGISVNAVAPGLTLPDENARLTQRFRALAPEVQQRLTATIALGRPATGADIAAMVCFLAQPKGAYVSGQVIAVSGGPWP
jgi:NAD(P)-dependent dehydrogenase (short-subunit alcohol dehydrogenase family)